MDNLFEKMYRIDTLRAVWKLKTCLKEIFMDVIDDIHSMGYLLLALSLDLKNGVSVPFSYAKVAIPNLDKQNKKVLLTHNLRYNDLQNIQLISWKVMTDFAIMVFIDCLFYFEICRGQNKTLERDWAGARHFGKAIF